MSYHGIFRFITLLFRSDFSLFSSSLFCTKREASGRIDSRSDAPGAHALQLSILFFSSYPWSLFVYITGEASEGEEDEQQQQQTEEEQQQQEVDQVTTENNDTITVLTHCSDKKKKNSLVNESIIPSAVIMPGQPAGVEERTGGGAPAWKPAQQAPVKSSAPPAFYPSNTNNHYSNGYSTGPGTRPAASAGSFRRGGGGGAPRYNNSNSYNGNSNGYNGPSYGRANSWNSGSYNNDHHHHHSHHQPPGGLGKTHGIEKKIFNDGA